MLLPSRADNDYRISVCHSQVLLPQFVCKEDTTPPYPHICDNIIADFSKISSSFQNTALHSNKYDKISRYDTPGNVFLFVYFLQKKNPRLRILHTLYQILLVLKNMLGWLANSESSFLMKRKH